MEVQHRAVGSARVGLPSWPWTQVVESKQTEDQLGISEWGQELHLRQTLRLLGHEISEQNGLVMT